MEKLKFLKDGTITYASDARWTTFGKVLEYVFMDEVPSMEVLTSGHELLNEFNDFVMDDRTAFTTIYHIDENNPNKIAFSNDGSVYVKPIPNVTFVANTGGNIEGEEVQTVNNYEDLVIPAPVANENYKFVKWVPEIPSSGVIECNVTFYATFEYIPTLDEIKVMKLNEISMISQNSINAGVTIDEVPYHYTVEKRQEIKAALEMAVQTGKSVTLYLDNFITQTLAPNKIQELYAAEEANLTHHLVYANQLSLYVNSLEDVESVNAVFYGQDLEDEYLNAYNEAITNNDEVITAYLDQLKYASYKDIETLQAAITRIQADLVSLNAALV